ncbi:MAG: hypothetical protein ACI837_001931 [Crocinitomicaceae bacterium]|jgi:hypothetical protein
MNRKHWLVCLLVLVSYMGMSQTYPATREKFVKDFQKKMAEYGTGDFRDFAKDKLPLLLLETQDFPEEYFTKMVATCNLMESKKLKDYPEVYNYIFSVTAFVEGKQPKSSFLAWHSTVDKMLDSRYVKKVEEFVEFSAGFFSTGQISESSNFAWYYIGGDYSFEFDKKVTVNLTEGDLVCRSISNSGDNKGETVDSLRVIGTVGAYDPVLKKWNGQGGTITWEKVGLDVNKTHAKLKSYDLSLKSSTLRVDTVSLTTPYFEKPILGLLSDRAFKFNREADKVYPQFLSFERRLLIKEIIKNVDYLGGFALQGSSFLGAGTSEERAEVTIKNNGSPFMIARAKQIIVSPKKVMTTRAEFVLLLSSGDSITHPGITLDYDLGKKQIQLVRTKNGIGEAPFQDSYHKLDIYVPKIIWDINSDSLHFTYEFGTSQQQRVAQFESQNYFDAQVYDRLQSMESTHPLVGISQYCYKFDEYEFSEGTAATALHKTIDQAKPLLLQLSSLGFISYDTETKKVIVNDKLNNFVKAKAGKRDYDNIVFNSDLRERKLSGYLIELAENDTTFAKQFKERNNEIRLKPDFAVMNLKTLELDLEAVDRVLISAVKNTMVFPHDGVVKVKSNRDFVYKGWTNAGKLETNAELAYFDYDAFKIKLQRTDESIFRVRPLDKTHGTAGIPMASALRGLTGEISIDDVSNRSGNNQKYGMYPKMTSLNKTKIFYNDQSIYRGAYDSLRFYYTVDPFELDSLNTFKESSFRLDGELVSAGIFPKIRQQVKIMGDYSFGFSTMAPEGGHKFYGTDAVYENKIVLSNNGLQGNGTINFIESTSTSKALSFLPDSTVGYAVFENRPVGKGSKVEFPDVQSERAYITYVPKQKLLRANSTPMSDLLMFNKEAKLRGTIIIKEEGMRGIGLMTFTNCNLISDNFRFTRYDVFADTSSFRLQNQSTDVSEDALAFKTDNVKSHVSFEERVGNFNSNEGETTMEFPVNQYMAKMDKFKWFMDELSIEMEKTDDKTIVIEAGVDGVKSNFFSLHKDQDNLNFRAPKATFNAKNKTIFCSKVEFIDIADARIYPDSSKLQIRRKAKIDKLYNAKIVANYITKYHTFEQAEVEIKARQDYNAAGKYPYYDADSTVTYVEMKDIGLDTSYQTRASGKVEVDANFKLSNEFDFYGDVSIRASNPLIAFAGATRINHSCDKFDRNWMAFRSEIDPKSIQIPVVSEMKDLEGVSISAGIVWRDSPNPDSISLYPTFLSALVDPGDPIVMTSNGYLQYDTGTKEFQIGSKDKLLNREEKGNYIALHTESCSMNGDGVINLGMDYGDAKVDAVGIVNYNQSTGETTMNITARFDMPLDKGIMQDVADRLNEVEGLQSADFSSNTLEQAIVEWDGLKAADKFVEEYTQLGKVKKLPDGLEKSITITGLRISSYESARLQDRGLITNVESAVLVNMFGKPIMKYVPLKAFFQQTYSGDKKKNNSDKFMLYVNIPGGRDYYFDYQMVQKDGTLSIKSGDEAMTSAINELKEDKRKKRNFKYEMTTNSAFLAKFMRLFE